ncbi:helix-turn-helix domain-containing protein [Paenibacillus sp. RC67]|uniref:helix-turn-helix domain-containing protein n=1 Tax=Paenibacillus sp. RC67 TaxID=3039392 RepID=UPI0024ADADBB|nr:helix-turn-helix domain-containing protein [Paenibacillus sp. RC67]
MNLRKLWWKRKSVVFTWIISYSTVLFVPILMSLIVYWQSSEALKSEIHRANDTLLKQVRDTIDTQLDHMQRLNMEVSWNTKLQDLMYSNRPFSEAQYTAYQVVQDYRMYQSSYASIDEFYVTWDKEESVLRPGSVRDFLTAFDTIHNTGRIGYEQWLNTIRKGNDFVLLPRVDAAEPRQSLAYITHLPLGAGAKPSGTVVIMADTSRFLKAIENIQWFSSGQVFVLNENNEVLISNTSEGLAPSALHQLGNGESGMFYDKKQSGEDEIFYIKSGVSKLKYVSVIPSRLYWEKAEYVRRFTYISILISIVGAGLLTWFFLRRNYSPIHRLVQTLSGNGASMQERTDWNELNFIHRAVSNTLSEKESIQLQLQKQNHMLRSNMLTRLLKGKLDSHIPLNEALKTFQVKLQSDRFAVIMFYIEDHEAFYSSFPGMDMTEKRRLLQFILTNVVEELVGQRHHYGYVAEADDMLTCIINFAEENAQQTKEDLSWIALEAQQFLIQRYKVEMTLSISGIHHTLAGVAQAYQEALDAMEYKMVLGKQEIISYDEIQKDMLNENQLGYFYPLQVEQQLINFIKIGDFDKAQVVLQEVTERNFGKPLLSLTLARCLMFNLISTMIKTINELGGMEDSFLASNPNWMQKIIASDTIKEMQEELVNLLNEVCSYAAAKLETKVSKEKTQSLRELADDVIRFIEGHYADVNLNVSMIGNEFDMKSSYLSKLFKEQTGEGLLDYINKYRIDQAKRLIRENQVPVSDTAKQVGFNEAATFIRVFKRYEGITPGKYKEME